MNKQKLIQLIYALGEGGWTVTVDSETPETASEVIAFAHDASHRYRLSVGLAHPAALRVKLSAVCEWELSGLIATWPPDVDPDALMADLRRWMTCIGEGAAPTETPRPSQRQAPAASQSTEEADADRPEPGNAAPAQHFLERLAKGLEEKGWVVATAAEPGEATLIVIDYVVPERPERSR